MTEPAERSDSAMEFPRAGWRADFQELPVFKRVLYATAMVGILFALMALYVVMAVYAVVRLSGSVIAAMVRGKKTPPPDHRPGKGLPAPALET